MDLGSKIVANWGYSDFKIRSIIVKELVKKKIETHFVFENIVANKSNNYIQVMNIFKLNKFLRRKTD